MHFIELVAFLSQFPFVLALNYSSPSLTCPSVDHADERLLQATIRDAVCQAKSNISCLNVNKIFDRYYQSACLVLHDNDWATVFLLNKLFVACNIPTLSLDVSSNPASQVRRLCTEFSSFFVISLNQFNFNTTTFPLVTNNTVVSTLLSSCSCLTWFSIDDDNCSQPGDFEPIYQVRRFGQDLIERSSLRNKVLIVATLPSEKELPWVIRHVDADGNVTYSGIIFELLTKFSTSFKFQFVIREPADQAWGMNVGNNTWNGLIGMLQRKEADVVATSLTITFARTQVVDFSSAFYLESLGILIQMPKTQGRVWRFAFLFSAKVWATIIIASFVSVLVIFGLHKFDMVDDSNFVTLMVKCVWYAFCSLVNQAARTVLKSWSGRAFLSFWQLFVVSIVATYGGSLVSLLTSNRYSLPFNDLKQLAVSVSKGETKVCVEDSTAFYSALLENDNAEYIQLRNFFAKNPDYVTTHEKCKLKVLQSTSVAYIAEISLLKNVQIESCSSYQLIVLADRFFPGYFAFAFQKYSTLSDTFTLGVTEIIESGLINVWKAKHSLRPSFCEIMEPDTKPVAMMQPLNVTEVVGAFLLLGVGLVFAFVFFVVELRKNFDCFHHNHRKTAVVMSY